MHITPTQRQLDYQSWEFGVFVHFGIRTFYEQNTDWDGNAMDLIVFNPKNLDCENWVKTVKDAGAKYMVMTAKHHDGFALWPSKYTGYSVANTPWKNGEGDVVREYSDACEKYGMKKGIYYSPADSGFDIKKRSGSEYDEYFLNQISELMTGYGDIDILWFDGNGSDGHTYNWKKIISEIRRMQPGILIFNMGDPDISWVGNEAGIAPNPHFNSKNQSFLNSHSNELLLDDRQQSAWLPAECDCMMCETTWFYNSKDESTMKSVDRLMGMYYYSVGRGANLLLNIGPDNRGLLPDKQAQRLLEFGNEIKRRFSSPIAQLNDFTRKDNRYVINLKNAVMIDHVVLSENLSKGESIRKYEIFCHPSPNHTEPIRIYDGYQVGHKAICMFPPICVKALWVEVTEYDKDYELSGLDIYYSASN